MVSSSSKKDSGKDGKAQVWAELNCLCRKNLRVVVLIDGPGSRENHKNCAYIYMVSGKGRPFVSIYAVPICPSINN